VEEDISGLGEDLFRNKATYIPTTELDLYFAKYLAEMSLEDEECDPTSYSLNSNLFRSPEFKKVDLITLGCSQTFGQGIDDLAIWPKLLSDSLGMSYVNLGMPAASVEDMVGSLFVYIRRYGKPKTVAALLPGYARISLPLKYEENSATDAKPSPTEKVGYSHLYLGYREVDGNRKDIPLYSKRPHKLDELLSYEVALHQSMFALSVLIEYCKVANIQLVFSSWNHGMNQLLEEKKNNPLTELDLSGCKTLFLEDIAESNCHTERQNDHSDIWHEARDCGHHMGAHAHIHYAELFEELIKNG